MKTKVPINKILKIVVSKSDEVALVVEKIIDADAKELVLSVPRFSKLADSLANFHLIKREAKLLSKKILVESVDDKVIELAGLAGLESLNPILSRSRRQFSDIVSSRYSREEAEESDIKKKKLVESVKRKPTPPHPFVFIPLKFKKLIWVVPALILVAGTAFAATNILPRAEIKITRTKISWNYNDAVRAEKLAVVDPSTATVPAQIFNQKENLELTFPASGKKNVAQRAGGKIIIYNAYSSDPQLLVATTRFITPEGKIFRLAKTVTVPGAKIVEGKIIPSSLEAVVIADQAGSDYNIGPVSYFSIPGFKGSPKYQAFYGESKNPMTGGFVGEVAFPTSEDIKKAKNAVAQKLQDHLKEKVLPPIPSDFKIIEGASSFNLTKQNVITSIDGSGNFNIQGEASMSVIAFKEADLLSMLAGKIKKEQGEDYEILKSDLSYDQARADFAAGRISFPVKFTSTLAKRIDIKLLKQQLQGKTESSLKSFIYSLPDLQSAVISLWPFWVKSVPQNESKITILVD